MIEWLNDNREVSARTNEHICMWAWKVTLIYFWESIKIPPLSAKNTSGIIPPGV